MTQLFTEHYMVEFLLHNTIGAWWCARHGIGPTSEVGRAFEPDSATDRPSDTAGPVDRGRKGRLSSTPPPSEPCERISRTRLSGQWSYLQEG